MEGEMEEEMEVKRGDGRWRWQMERGDVERWRWSVAAAEGSGATLGHQGVRRATPIALGKHVRERGGARGADLRDGSARKVLSLKARR